MGRAQEHEGQLGILVEASWLLQQPPQPEIHTRSSFLAHRTPTSGALLLWILTEGSCGAHPSVDNHLPQNMEDLRGGFPEPDIPLAGPQPLGPTHMQGTWTGESPLAIHLGGGGRGMAILWSSLPQNRDRD